MESTAATPDEPMTLRQEDLPAIYQAADQNSIEAQRRFLRRSDWVCSWLCSPPELVDLRARCG